MNRTKSLIGLSLLMCSGAYASTILPVAPCVTGSLASYIALGSTGCSIGYPTLVFNDFSFAVTATSGGAIAVLPTAITVTPVISPSMFGLNYAATGFSVTAGQSIQYLLGYNVDDPPIIHGLVMYMNDPPTPPGMASITSVECLDSAFSGSVCPTSTVTQMVFDNGTTSSLTSIQTFAPDVRILGDLSTISLDASKGGTADVKDFTELAIVVPEPATAWFAGAGLALLFTLKRRGRRLC